MRLWNLQSGIAIMVMFSIGTSPFAFSEEDHANEQTVASAVSKPEDKVVTRQQALITGMKELQIPRFQLERIAQLLENNPKTTAEQFAKLIDLTAETIPGFLTKTQVEKLKKLYKDELGQVKAEPATEFVSAAKVVASKLPVKPGPETPPANPDIASDPKNLTSTLSGATITPPGRADSFPAFSGLGKSTEDTKGLKALEERVATLQDSLARQQLAAASKAGENGGQDGKTGGLAEQLLGLLRKEEGGGRGRNGDDRGGRNRDREAPHTTPPPSKNDSDDSRDRKSDSELSKRGNERDNNRDRQRGNPPQQPANSDKKDGQGKDDSKKGDDKDKKAEPIIQAGELSKEKKEPKAKESEKTAPDLKAADDSLANATEVLAGKPKKKVSLGEGKTAEAIPASNQVASAAGAAKEEEKGNGGASSPPVVGGQKGSGESGGSGLGETPSANGDTGGGGGGGSGGQTYNFIRLTEFMAASGGDSTPDTNPGGFFDDSTATPARRPGVPLGSETLHIGPATETAKGWLLDVVYNWRKKICDGPDRNKVAWCFNLPKKVAGRASEPLIIRSGMQ